MHAPSNQIVRTGSYESGRGHGVFVITDNEVPKACIRRRIIIGSLRAAADMDIGSGNQNMGSIHTLEHGSFIDLEVRSKTRNDVSRFRFQRHHLTTHRRNISLCGIQRNSRSGQVLSQLRVVCSQLIDWSFECRHVCGESIPRCLKRIYCLEGRGEGTFRFKPIWLLNQAVLPIVISIVIPGECDGGKGRQNGACKNPRHDSPTNHGDPDGCLTEMNVATYRVHLTPPLCYPPSQKPGNIAQLRMRDVPTPATSVS